MVVSGSRKRWQAVAFLTPYTANWGMDYATYHLLREPETTIDPTTYPWSHSFFADIRSVINL